MKYYSTKHDCPLKEKKSSFWVCQVCKTNHLVKSTRYSCKKCSYNQCKKCFDAFEKAAPAPQPPQPVVEKDLMAAEKKKIIVESISSNKDRVQNWLKDSVNPDIFDKLQDASGASVRLLINHKGKKYVLPELIATELTVKQLKLKINQLLKISVVTIHRSNAELSDEKHLWELEFADDDLLIINRDIIREPKVEEIVPVERGDCKINSKSAYRSIMELQDDLKRSGLESSNLILAIDYTKSNLTQGRYTFMGQSLHSLNAVGKNGKHIDNPYQTVMYLLSKTLSQMDDDNLIPCFGFGDITTTDRSIFPFLPNGQPSLGIDNVLKRYNEITPMVTLSGPTSFGPIVRKAIEIVRETKQYHILIIIADGEVQRVKDTAGAIIEASNYPISIIIVGVGDGPFGQLEEFDNQLTSRKFDNLNFVNFHEITNKSGNLEDLEAEFVIKALEEIPSQFRAILELGLLDM